jgi:hypothetical protein
MPGASGSQRNEISVGLSRQRARSRSARTVGVRSQMAGTTSCRESSASTQASIFSVLQASGAKPLTLFASAISDLPARQLHLIVHESGAVHGLDRCMLPR